jgi:hypothetical protein
MSKTFHIGTVLAMVVFGISLFMMKRVNLRATQLGNNSMAVTMDHKHWVYACICTAIFIVFYLLVAREFRDIEKEHDQE